MTNQKIWFDKKNKVWHYDHSYHSDNLTCNKKEIFQQLISNLLSLCA